MENSEIRKKLIAREPATYKGYPIIDAKQYSNEHLVKNDYRPQIILILDLTEKIGSIWLQQPDYPYIAFNKNK